MSTLVRMSLQEQVSDNVRVLAVARGTTPAAIARSVGKTPAWIQAKISGRIRWYVEDVENLARELDVEPEQLLSKAWWPAVRPRQDSNLQPTDLWSLAA
jgi:hypothetical protein